MYSLDVYSMCVTLRQERNLRPCSCLSYLLTNWLAYLYGRIQSPKPKARRYARPKGGHYEGRGLLIRLYRYASQLVRSLLPD